MNDDNTYVVTSPTGKAIGRKFHIGNSCPAFTDTPNYVQVSDHEIGLLGLKLCAVCEKRQTGGPAIAVLTELLGELMETGGLSSSPGALNGQAWQLFDGLKERGFYIASRRKKDGAPSPS